MNQDLKNNLLNDLLNDYKIINDIIHGSVNLSKLAMMIIDTPEFQRLRYLKQLSTCYFVFPNAIHTRFEHSIGTYHIAKKMLYSLKNKSKTSELNKISEIPELNKYFKMNKITDNYLTPFIIELVCIGALCHDLGHGPYSHLFDDYFLKNNDIQIKDKNFIHHEYRSCMILKNIINFNKNLKNIIEKDKDINIYPSIQNIFKSFYLTSYNSLKFVFLGQDPYHNEGSATGLCFEVGKNNNDNTNDNKIIKNPSLKNIEKEYNDYVKKFIFIANNKKIYQCKCLFYSGNIIDIDLSNYIIIRDGIVYVSTFYLMTDGIHCFSHLIKYKYDDDYNIFKLYDDSIEYLRRGKDSLTDHIYNIINKHKVELKETYLYVDPNNNIDDTICEFVFIKKIRYFFIIYSTIFGNKIFMMQFSLLFAL